MTDKIDIQVADETRQDGNAADAFDQGAKILVVGVGGGGSNAVDHMIESGVQGVDFLVANTDSQALERSKAKRRIKLGEDGLGAGGNPEKGCLAAEAAESDFRSIVQGYQMVFVAAGMGGGTGTGSAPVFARIAREAGALTVSVVTKPFDWEGSRRMRAAEEGLAELQANVDSLIVVLNDKLHEVFGDDVLQSEAFRQANDVLKSAVGGLVEVITNHGHINVDFADVHAVMHNSGRAIMGTGQATGKDRARQAAEQAVACPLLEGADLSGARGVLVLVAAARDTLRMDESRIASNTVQANTKDATFIYGFSYDESLGDAIRITIIATGLAEEANAAATFKVVQNTGTWSAQPVAPVSSPAAPAAGTAPARPPEKQVWTSNTARNAGANVPVQRYVQKDNVNVPAFTRHQAD